MNKKNNDFSYDFPSLSLLSPPTPATTPTRPTTTMTPPTRRPNSLAPSMTSRTTTTTTTAPTPMTACTGTMTMTTASPPTTTDRWGAGGCRSTPMAGGSRPSDILPLLMKLTPMVSLIVFFFLI